MRLPRRPTPAAQYLLDRGGDLNWIGYDHLTPVDAARRSGAHELAGWLEDNGARNADQVWPTDTTGTGRSS